MLLINTDSIVKSVEYLLAKRYREIGYHRAMEKAGLQVNQEYMAKKQGMGSWL